MQHWFGSALAHPASQWLLSSDLYKAEGGAVSTPTVKEPKAAGGQKVKDPSVKAPKVGAEASGSSGQSAMLGREMPGHTWVSREAQGAHPDGGIKYKYRYSMQQGLGREAKAGQEYNVGYNKDRAGSAPDEKNVVRVKGASDRGVTFEHQGKEQSVSHQDWHKFMESHFGDDYTKAVDSSVKKWGNAVYKHVPKETFDMLWDKPEGKTMSSQQIVAHLSDATYKVGKTTVGKKLQNTFKRIGVSDENAVHHMVGYVLSRRNWDNDARASMLGAAAFGGGFSAARVARNYKSMALSAERGAGRGNKVTAAHVYAAVKKGNYRDISQWHAHKLISQHKRLADFNAHRVAAGLDPVALKKQKPDDKDEPDGMLELERHARGQRLWESRKKGDSVNKQAFARMPKPHVEPEAFQQWLGEQDNVFRTGKRQPGADASEHGGTAGFKRQFLDYVVPEKGERATKSKEDVAPVVAHSKAAGHTPEQAKAHEANVRATMDFHAAQAAKRATSAKEAKQGTGAPAAAATGTAKPGAADPVTSSLNQLSAGDKKQILDYVTQFHGDKRVASIQALVQANPHIHPNAVYELLRQHSAGGVQGTSAAPSVGAAARAPQAPPPPPPPQQPQQPQAQAPEPPPVAQQPQQPATPQAPPPPPQQPQQPPTQAPETPPLSQQSQAAPEHGRAQKYPAGSIQAQYADYWRRMAEARDIPQEHHDAYVDHWVDHSERYAQAENQMPGASMADLEKLHEGMTRETAAAWDAKHSGAQSREAPQLSQPPAPEPSSLGPGPGAEDAEHHPEMGEHPLTSVEENVHGAEVELDHGNSRAAVEHALEAVADVTSGHAHPEHVEQLDAVLERIDPKELSPEHAQMVEAAKDHLDEVRKQTAADTPEDVAQNLTQEVAQAAITGDEQHIHEIAHRMHSADPETPEGQAAEQVLAAVEHGNAHIAKQRAARGSVKAAKSAVAPFADEKFNAFVQDKKIHALTTKPGRKYAEALLQWAQAAEAMPKTAASLAAKGPEAAGLSGPTKEQVAKLVLAHLGEQRAATPAEPPAPATSSAAEPPAAATPATSSAAEPPAATPAATTASSAAEPEVITLPSGKKRETAAPTAETPATTTTATTEEPPATADAPKDARRTTRQQRDIIAEKINERSTKLTPEQQRIKRAVDDAKTRLAGAQQELRNRHFQRVTASPEGAKKQEQLLDAEARRLWTARGMTREPEPEELQDLQHEALSAVQREVQALPYGPEHPNVDYTRLPKGFLQDTQRISGQARKDMQFLREQNEPFESVPEHHLAAIPSTGEVASLAEQHHDKEALAVRRASNQKAWAKHGGVTVDRDSVLSTDEVHHMVKTDDEKWERYTTKAKQHDKEASRAMVDALAAILPPEDYAPEKGVPPVPPKATDASVVAALKTLEALPDDDRARVLSNVRAYLTRMVPNDQQRRALFGDLVDPQVTYRTLATAAQAEPGPVAEQPAEAPVSPPEDTKEPGPVSAPPAEDPPAEAPVSPPEDTKEPGPVAAPPAAAASSTRDPEWQDPQVAAKRRDDNIQGIRAHTKMLHEMLQDPAVRRETQGVKTLVPNLDAHGPKARRLDVLRGIALQEGKDGWRLLDSSTGRAIIRNQGYTDASSLDAHAMRNHLLAAWEKLGMPGTFAEASPEQQREALNHLGAMKWARSLRNAEATAGPFSHSSPLTEIDPAEAKQFLSKLSTHMVNLRGGGVTPEPESVAREDTSEASPVEQPVSTPEDTKEPGPVSAPPEAIEPGTPAEAPAALASEQSAAAAPSTLEGVHLPHDSWGGIETYANRYGSDPTKWPKDGQALLQEAQGQKLPHTRPVSLAEYQKQDGGAALREKHPVLARKEHADGSSTTYFEHSAFHVRPKADGSGHLVSPLYPVHDPHLKYEASTRDDADDAARRHYDMHHAYYAELREQGHKDPHLGHWRMTEPRKSGTKWVYEEGMRVPSGEFNHGGRTRYFPTKSAALHEQARHLEGFAESTQKFLAAKDEARRAETSPATATPTKPLEGAKGPELAAETPAVAEPGPISAPARKPLDAGAQAAKDRFDRISRGEEAPADLGALVAKQRAEREAKGITDDSGAQAAKDRFDRIADGKEEPRPLGAAAPKPDAHRSTVETIQADPAHRHLVPAVQEAGKDAHDPKALHGHVMDLARQSFHRPYKNPKDAHDIADAAAQASHLLTGVKPVKALRETRDALAKVPDEMLQSLPAEVHEHAKESAEKSAQHWFDQAQHRGLLSQEHETWKHDEAAKDLTHADAGKRTKSLLGHWLPKLGHAVKKGVAGTLAALGMLTAAGAPSNTADATQRQPLSSVSVDLPEAPRRTQATATEVAQDTPVRQGEATARPDDPEDDAYHVGPEETYLANEWKAQHPDMDPTDYVEAGHLDADPDTGHTKIRLDPHEVPLTGNKVADKAIQMARDLDGKTFFGLGLSGGKNKEGKIGYQCSSFSAKAAGLPQMDTTAIHADAKKKSGNKYYKEVPAHQAEAGDMLVYPDYKIGKTHHEGHVAVIVDATPGQMKIADASKSDNGVHVRQLHPSFAFMPKTIVARPLKNMQKGLDSGTLEELDYTSMVYT